MLRSQVFATPPQNAETTPRILVVDDDVNAANSLAGLLSLYGYVAQAAIGGAEAISMLDSNPFDIILLDLGMPEVSGQDVLKHLSLVGNPAKVIIVSGEGSLNIMREALKMGAYDYIRKPYNPDELLATVRNAMRRIQLDWIRISLENKLEQAENIHRFLVENSPDLIFTIDSSAVIRYANPRLSEFIGNGGENLADMQLSSIVSADDKAKLFYCVDKLLHRNVPSMNTEIRFVSSKRPAYDWYFDLTMIVIDDADAVGRAATHHHIYGIARDITERRQAQKVIQFQAQHDALTGLPNRNTLNDRLRQLISNQKRNNVGFSLLFVDLDRFKVVNDTLGHPVGDHLLSIVSKRLATAVRKSDTVSRYGGDEFVVLLPETSGIQTAEHVATKIIDTLHEPYHVDSQKICLGASVGIAMFPEHGTTVEELISHSDSAMYRAKKNGRNTFQVFTPQLADDEIRVRRLERDMRKSLETGDFDIYFQRQVELSTAALVGLEALVRWNHPALGRLTPDQFLNVAYDSRLIVDLDLNTLRNACRAVLAERARGAGEFRLSVNFSPLLLEIPNFSDKTLDILSDEGFDPELLDIEITENVSIADSDDIILGLKRLRDFGVRIALDDFGTGYSSLRYLQKLPINIVKIDKSFVKSLVIDDFSTQIVNTIVAMAKSLKLTVIAEGVENEQQMEYLQKIGCELAQGYLHGVPKPIGEIFGAPQTEILLGPRSPFR